MNAVYAIAWYNVPLQIRASDVDATTGFTASPNSLEQSRTRRSPTGIDRYQRPRAAARSLSTGRTNSNLCPSNSETSIVHNGGTRSKRLVIDAPAFALTGSARSMLQKQRHAFCCAS